MDLHDYAAERALLGAMMLTRGALEAGLELGDDDFHNPAHALVFAALADTAATGQPVEATTVLDVIRRRDQLNRIGGAPYLHTLLETPPTPGTAGHYVGIIREHSRRRQLREAADQIAHRATADPDPAEDVIDWAAQHLARVRDRHVAVDEAATPVDALLAQEITYDWLVPGLLERGDRMILTGVEGLGKSTALAQIAVCVAAGLHPFTRQPITPLRVLVVDCENGRGLLQRRYGPLVGAARYAGYDPGERLWIDVRTDGLDLAAHHDRRWLARRVERYKPDLLVTGPIYRLHQGDPNDERSARQVAASFDRIRADSGCALILEAHAGHGNGMTRQRPVRPLGSSLWLRWPEFGYGLRLAEDDDADRSRLCDLVPWRGPREERAWPAQVVRGGAWPWDVYDISKPGQWSAA